MQPEYRISKITGLLMLGTALFIDLLELIMTALAIGVVANWITWLLSWMIFPLWFLIKGAPYTKDKKMMRGAVIGAIIGLIPVISALPELTTVIWLNIRSSRIEDEKVWQAQESRENKAQKERKQRLIEKTT